LIIAVVGRDVAFVADLVGMLGIFGIFGILGSDGVKGRIGVLSGKAHRFGSRIVGHRGSSIVACRASGKIRR